MTALKTSWFFCCAIYALALFPTVCHAEIEQADTSSTAEIREQAIAWIQKNAVRLTSMTAGSGFQDLEPVAGMIGDAKVIGLGEASHGTREFFQFKHRMLEYLVEHHGFRLFGIEANFASCLPISNYVLTGEGDPEALVNGMGFWTWDTEEVIELVKWMRTYNQTHEDKVNFFGFDIQYAPPGLQIALDFIAPVDAAKHSYFREALGAYLPGDKTYLESVMEIYNEPPDKRMVRHDNTAELLSFFDQNEGRLVAAGGADRYDIARTAAYAVERTFARSRPTEGETPSEAAYRSFTIRDQAMADMAVWGLGHYGPDQRAVLWAHNAHIQTASFEWGGKEARYMGLNLADALGSQYVSLGFGFSEGGLQARAMPGPGFDKTSEPPPLQEFTVPPAGGISIGGTMRDSGMGDFLIDLRELDADESAKRWFSTPHPMRQPGAAYVETPVEQWKKLTLSSSFDLFVFVEKTTRARPSELSRQRFGLDKTW